MGSTRFGLIVFLALVSVGGCRGRPAYEGKSVAQLEKMLRDSNPAVQSQGAFGLSLLGPDAQPAVPGLIEALQGDTLLRQNAALALGKIGPEARSAVPALIRALRDPEWVVRRQAAIALGQIGQDAREAVPALQSLTREPDSLVRKAAQGALSAIQGGQKKGR